jgi:hypothetical protein
MPSALPVELHRERCNRLDTRSTYRVPQLISQEEDRSPALPRLIAEGVASIDKYVAQVDTDRHLSSEPRRWRGCVQLVLGTETTTSVATAANVRLMSPSSCQKVRFQQDSAQQAQPRQHGCHSFSDGAHFTARRLLR